MIDSAQTHLARALAFLRDAKSAKSSEDKSRYLAAATENSVAVVEVLRKHAKDEQEIRKLAISSLPRYQ